MKYIYIREFRKCFKNILLFRFIFAKGFGTQIIFFKMHLALFSRFVFPLRAYIQIPIYYRVPVDVNTNINIRHEKGVPEALNSKLKKILQNGKLSYVPSVIIGRQTDGQMVQTNRQKVQADRRYRQTKGTDKQTDRWYRQTGGKTGGQAYLVQLILRNISQNRSIGMAGELQRTRQLRQAVGPFSQALDSLTHVVRCEPEAGC